MFNSWLARVRQSAKSKVSRKRAARRRAFFQPLLEGLEDRQVPAVLMVTTTADSGAGSLRQAILDANNTATNPGQNTIDFNIASSGVQTIALASTLPAITNPSGVIIDATTEPGFTSTPLVVLNGSGAGSSDGLDVSGGNSTVKGLAIENFAAGAGIFLHSGGNTVSQNFLGTNSTGNTAAGNLFGVLIAAANNTIGGTTSTARNVISGNGDFGIDLVGSSTSGNLIEGNFIGTNAAGSGALANTFDGVALINVGHNTIGGSTSGAGNVISGNGRFGVFIYGSSSTGNVLQGNSIGVNTGGTATLANADDGVALYGGASANTVGGTTSSAANVLSGNGRFGLLLSDSGTSGNLVEGNFIGVNRAGTSVLANTSDGVDILSAASGNTIGGTTTGTGNTIAGNGRFGVLVGVSGTTGNVIAGNFIGTNNAGAAGLGNSSGGVGLVTGATGNTLGGTTSGAANVISGNTNFGILLTDASTTGNLIEGNLVGTTPGATATLANTLDGIAVMGAPSNTIGGTTTGAANVISGNSQFGIVLAANNTQVQGNFIGTDAASDNKLGNTDDGILILSSGNTIGGTASGAGNTVSGNKRFGIQLQGTGATGNLIQGNSVGSNPAGTVSQTNIDDGIALYAGASNNTIGGTAGSAANVLSGNGRFGLLLSDSGTTGNVVEGNVIGVNKSASAILANTNSGVAILNGASGNTIGGTATGAANILSGNGQMGVLIGGSGTTGNVVQGNFIGTNSGGTASLPNLYAGVMVATGASNNTIGGTVTGAANTIALNGYGGVIVGVNTTDTAAGDLVSMNAIYTNGGSGGIGIDLGNNGTTANNASGHTGPNHFQNFPVPTTASLSAGAVTVSFTFTSVASSTFRLEFFLNNSSDTLAEGRFFLGSATVTTDATGALATVTGGSVSAGTGTITLTPPAGVTPAAGQRLTAVASLQTTPGAAGTAGDTSEFSPPVTVSTPSGATISPSTLPAANLNTPYSQTLSLSGGTAPVTFSVTSGTVPTGLNLSTNGVLSGTPTTTTGSPFSFTVMATDSASPTPHTATQNYTIVVHSAVMVTTTSLPDWTEDKSGYNQTITATGGSGSYTFSATGSVPPGLTLSTGGVLSGTPAQTGNFAFTVTAMDTLGGSGSESYSVTINAPPAITTSGLASWTVNHPGYNQSITTIGGTGTVTLSAVNLPPGLSLSSTGVLSGTPTAVGPFTFTVTATDSVGATGMQTYTVPINPAVTVSPSSLPAGAPNAAYNQTITASGGTGAKTFAVTTGNVPTGLTLSTGGVLSGTPTANGNFSFTVTATDTVGATGSHAYTVVITPVLTISPASLPADTVNVAYNQMLMASGGTGAVTFATTAGMLPPGVTLSTGGVFSGTPTTTGSFSFTVTATDSTNTMGSHAYTIVINAAPTISPATLPGQSPAKKILYYVDGTNGTDEMAAALAALTPPNMVVTASSATDFATKITTGGFDLGIFSAQMNYDATYTTALTDLATFVQNGGKAIVDSWATFAGTDLTPFGATPTGDVDGPAVNLSNYNGGIANPLALTNTTPPYTAYSFGETPTTGSVVAGVFSDPGNASGTNGEAAMVAGNSGRSIVNGFLNDIGGAAGKLLYENEINTLLGVTGVDTVGVLYTQTFMANGGTGNKTFSITAGTLPAGLTLSTAGVLSGTPTAAGSYTFTVTAADTVGATASDTYSVLINPAMAISPTSLPAHTVNAAYNQTLTASGGTGSKTFALTSGSLPSGITLSTAGVLSGTTTASGSFSFTVTATDTVGATAMQSYMI